MEEWQLAMIGFIIFVIVVFIYQHSTKADNSNNTSALDNSNKSITKIPADCTLLNIDDFLNKYRNASHVFPDAFQWDITNAILKGERYIIAHNSIIAEIDRKAKEYWAHEAKLYNCAYRNNQGINFEKCGDIQNAINIYEENIADGFPALHSFNRLMIIYRRLKDYDNEIRVIDYSIKLFSNFNERYENDIIKWKERREKAIKLQNKLTNNNN